MTYKPSRVLKQKEYENNAISRTNKYYAKVPMDVEKVQNV